MERLRFNQFIRVSQVRLVDEDGKQLGIKPTQEALSIAREKGLDLVEIAPNASPPVCKIISYSKFKYQQKKKDKQQHKKQKIGQVKEVRFKVTIEDHDFEFKVKHIREFLEQKCRVKVTIMFVGREMTHTELGFNLIDRIKEKIEDIAETQEKPKFEGKRIVVLFSPKK